MVAGINNENQNTTPIGEKSLNTTKKSAIYTESNTTKKSAIYTESWTDIITT